MGEGIPIKSGGASFITSTPSKDTWRASHEFDKSPSWVELSTILKILEDERNEKKKLAEQVEKLIKLQ